MWVAFGSMWHGYEVQGWENVPDEGPALLVYYHGAVPIDYYQLVGNCILKKRRVIHSVVDKFLFKVNYLTNALQINSFKMKIHRCKMIQVSKKWAVKD